jgi:hypothetical protein
MGLLFFVVFLGIGAAVLAGEIPDLLLDGFKLISHLTPSPTIGMR